MAGLPSVKAVLFNALHPQRNEIRIKKILLIVYSSLLSIKSLFKYYSPKGNWADFSKFMVCIIAQFNLVRWSYDTMWYFLNRL